MLKTAKKYIFWIAIILLVTYCALSNKSRYQSHEDAFYNDTGEFPSERLPLIKPYYVYSREGNPWTLWLSTTVKTTSSNGDYSYYVYDHIVDVQKLSVQNNIIMAYSPRGEEKADEGFKDLHWFVVIPAEKIAMGFENEDDFLTYLQEQDIQQPDWRATDEIFKEYWKTECLNWIPDCQ